MNDDVFVAPLQEEDVFITALTYPFWFIVSPFLLFTSKKEIAFVRFHIYQSMIFGFFMSILNIIITFIFYFIMKAQAKITNPSSGIIFISIFLLYTLLLMIFFSIFIYYSYITSKGRLVNIPFITPWVKAKVLEFLPNYDDISKKNDSFKRIV